MKNIVKKQKREILFICILIISAFITSNKSSLFGQTPIPEETVELTDDNLKNIYSSDDTVETVDGKLKFVDNSYINSDNNGDIQSQKNTTEEDSTETNTYYDYIDETYEKDICDEDFNESVFSDSGIYETISSNYEDHNYDLEECYKISVEYGDILYAYKTKDTSILSEENKKVYEILAPEIDYIKSTYSDLFYQEKEAHDFICKTCSYEFNEYDQTPYGVFVLGKAVCGGYSNAFKLMMDLLNIENKRVIGNAFNDLHAWNLVKLDGEWYLVDVTWDDADYGYGYEYFNVSDAEHSECYNASETCDSNSRKYSYYLYSYNNKIFTNGFDEKLYNYINNQLDLKKTSFEVAIYSEGSDSEDIMNAMNSIESIKVPYNVKFLGPDLSLHLGYDLLIVKFNVTYMEFNNAKVFNSDTDIYNYIEEMYKGTTPFDCWIYLDAESPVTINSHDCGGKWNEDIEFDYGFYTYVHYSYTLK